jgi:peptidoglycan hydrolase-like protein with peptidoglycan-binding domain
MNIKTKIVTALSLAVFIIPGLSLAQTMSVAQLQAEIVSLTAQLTQLESQLAAAGGTTATWCYAFNTNLSIGMSGADVTALQTALQKDGESVTINGAFDDQTAAAVTGFQEKYASAILSPYGLSNGTGYAGKSTRSELNSLFGCGATPVRPVGPEPVQPTPVNPSPAMSVYQNSRYGVRFSYPINYTVKNGSDGLNNYGAFPLDSNATSLVTIEMPGSFYPNTNFGGAALNVSVNSSLNSSQCYALVNPNAVPGQPSQGDKSIDGVTFNWIDGGGAAAGTSMDEGHGAGYSNGICYEFNAGAQYSDVTPDGVTWAPFNSFVLTSALNSVLATMTFSAVNPPVVCPAWGCGNPPITTSTAWAAPSINPLNPSSGPLGTMITITGSGFHNGNALMGDSNSVVWISNGSQKGVLASYQPQIDTMTAEIPYSVCQTNNAYSGAPCSSSMILAPGNYSIYVVNGNGTSNSEPFTVTTAITSYPSTFISVSNPQSGAIYQAGNAVSIAWIPVSGLSSVGLGVVDANGVVVGNTNGTPGTLGMITTYASDNGTYQWQIPSTFPAGTYRISVTGNNNGVAYQGYSGYFSISTPTVVSYNGTLNVSVDPSTPVAGTVAAGTKNVTFATIKLTATGGNVNAQWFSVVSNAANAVSGLSNIKIFEGGNLLGTVSNLLPLASAPGGYANVPESAPVVITNGQSVTLTLMADIAPSASGMLDLGIGGGGGAIMSPNYSVYGNNMTVAGASSGISTMLNIVPNNNLLSGPVQAGTSNVMVGYYSINNPSTEPVTLNQLTLDFGQSSAILNNVGIALNFNGQIAIVPSLNLSTGDISPSVTLNSNAVTIPAGGSASLEIYANIGASSPSGATETTSVKSCSAQGNISNAVYSCNATTGYEFMVR